MPPTIKRQSAAVMFTDIAGYTEIMASDEEKALSLLQDKRKVLKPLIDKHDGVYVKGTGDGTLSYFDSAYKASKCAKLFQESIYDNDSMNVRVGIHVGDIVLDDGDVYGDGVNVASRLESMSPVGGICVSNTVYDELRNKKDFDGVELGLQSLKGVGRLVEIYGLKGDLLTEPKPSDYQDNKVAVHSDDEVPSIAIIPFENKGKDEDVFYAYGISADLISDCSGAGLIRVSSLKQIEELGDLNVKEKAKKLNVRYISTGTLWRVDNMFQLSIELYDTKESKVVWSDRWQEKWENLPVIKGNLSEGLLKALDTKLLIDKKVETNNTEAYEYYLKGLYRLQKTENIEDKEIARGLLKKAIELDDNLIYAKGMLGFSYKISGNYNKAMKILLPAIKQAEKLDEKCALGQLLYFIGVVYYQKGDYYKSLDVSNRSLKIFEEINDKGEQTVSLHHISIVYDISGNVDKAIKYIKRSFEVCKDIEDERGVGVAYCLMSKYYWRKGDLDRALKNGLRSLKIIENKSHWTWENAYPCCLIGAYYLDKGDSHTAIEYLEKSILIQKDIGNKDILLATTKYLFLAYKNLGKKYNEAEIHNIIKETVHIDWEDNYRFFQLLENIDYLETAYNQVQELAANLEPDVAAKFLSYPIPKAIVEEWEKVK
jgi:class 3 adenylate cyclase/TolB-like protein